MKRFAFHKLYAPVSVNETTLQVVVTDDEGYYHTHYALEGEMPGVTWLGGIGVLLPQEVVPRAGDSVAVLLMKAGEIPKETDRLRVWKACGMSAFADVGLGVSVWKPVF